MGNSNQFCFNVNSIFDSYQGEGNWIGVRCTFIRFATCNLKCPWCDTDFRFEGAKAKTYSMEELLKLPLQKRVVLTGGEPLFQPNITFLAEDLSEAGYRVHFETNGTYEFIARDRSRFWITVSPKPGNNYKFVTSLKPDELKYVVSQELQLEHINRDSDNTILWLMPQDGWEGSFKKTQEFLEKIPKARLGIQAHKFWEIE